MPRLDNSLPRVIEWFGLAFDQKTPAQRRLWTSAGCALTSGQKYGATQHTRYTRNRLRHMSAVNVTTSSERRTIESKHTS